MTWCNLNMYDSTMIKNISYDEILDLPVRYPDYVIQRPLADEYLFYTTPGKRFYNYFKSDY